MKGLACLHQILTSTMFVIVVQKKTKLLPQYTVKQQEVYTLIAIAIL